MRRLILLSVVCSWLVLDTAGAAAQARFGLEPNTNRQGGDYVALFASTTEACLALCQADARCSSYTFVRNAQNGAANCWLKDSVPTASDNNCCDSGVRGSVKDLAIVSVNMKAHSSIPEAGGSDSIPWRLRYERLAEAITASGRLPELISLTEVGGWEWCTWGNGANDYEAIAVLVDELARRTGVVYRIAYLVGNESTYGGPRCQMFSGDALLYDARRLVNRTPEDTRVVTSLTRHDASWIGPHLRRSLPICNPAQPSVLFALIDGAPQSEKCGATPSGPAWALGTREGKVIASMARFSYLFDARASFEVFTVHPPVGRGMEVADPLAAFIDLISFPPLRTETRLYPTLLVGDVNELIDVPWLPSFTQIASANQINPGIANALDGGEVMAIMRGGAAGETPPRLTPVHVSSQLLPQNAQGCGPFTSGGHFSDHCGLRADFAGDGSPEHPDCEGLRVRERAARADLLDAERALELPIDDACLNGSVEGSDHQSQKPNQCTEVDDRPERAALEAAVKKAKGALTSVLAQKRSKECWR